MGLQVLLMEIWAIKKSARFVFVGCSVSDFSSGAVHCNCTATPLRRFGVQSNEQALIGEVIWLHLYFTHRSHGAGPSLKTQINLIPDCPQCGIRMTRTRPFPGSRSQEDDGRIRWPSGLQYLLMAILILISTLLPNGFLYIWSSEVFIHESVGLTSTQWNIPRGWQIWAMSVCGIVIISISAMLINISIVISCHLHQTWLSLHVLLNAHTFVVFFPPWGNFTSHKLDWNWF